MAKISLLTVCCTPIDLVDLASSEEFDDTLSKVKFKTCSVQTGPWTGSLWVALSGHVLHYKLFLASVLQSF